MKLLPITLSLLFFVGCNRVNPLPDAQLPSCVSYKAPNLSKGGIYNVSVDRGCWRLFLKMMSQNGGARCEMQLKSGDGCEYSTRASTFLLSPVRDERPGRRKYTLTDLRY